MEHITEVPNWEKNHKKKRTITIYTLHHLIVFVTG